MDVWPGPTQHSGTPLDDDILELRFGDPEVTELHGLVDGLDYHVVRAGESLSSIAALELGDPAFASTLAELNALSNPDLLAEGQVLWLR